MSIFDGVGYLFLIYLKCLLSIVLLDSLKFSCFKKFNYYQLNIMKIIVYVM